MKIGPYSLTLTKAGPPLSPLSSRATWYPYVAESFTGAWQQNVTVVLEDVISHPTAWACITLIAADIAKNAVCLVEKDDDGIWTEVDRNSPFWPVLRKPNRYQTRIEFFESWLISKLTRGNTYVFKVYDNRGICVEMHVLDPGRVTPLVAPDGSVYYQLKRDDLSGLKFEEDTVPARFIIHDRGPTLYHPLIGVSPIYAAGVAAMQGLKIQFNQTKLFINGAHPGGVIEVPGEITQATADRIKAAAATYNSEGESTGKTMVLGSGMTFKQVGMTAVDTDLIKQLEWTDEKICSAYHMPAYMVGVGEQPPYNNIEAIYRLYYQQCLQIHFEEIELLLDEGLGLSPYGSEFDLDNLMRMDSASQMEVLAKGVGAGILTPNEGRKAMNRKPVKGGNTPYLQEQNWPIEQLAGRDINPPAPAAMSPEPVEDLVPSEEDDDEELTLDFVTALHEKAAAEGLYEG